ncbi:uncharacterized protein LOC109600113 isoform X2 [Aethina tumida]|uniref:uncharacterized protein LOC109600113 isoform X2 n=1 Tax=Aethina tumida TaxID=116153 RepID=UPI00096AE785|nr:uncharacterized protein LOC109600113 isoform X2 [Aethina tumida]
MDKTNNAESEQGTSGLQESQHSKQLAARDSKWAGIKLYKTEKRRGGTIGDDESEIQTIDRDGELQPLLLLFPELNDDQDLVNQIRSKTMSPTTITRALMGKKADFTLLKPAQPLHETIATHPESRSSLSIARNARINKVKSMKNLSDIEEDDDINT